MTATNVDALLEQADRLEYRVERVKHSGTLKHEWSGVSDTEDVSKHRMFHETSLKLHVFLAIPGLSDHESRCAGL